MDNFVECVNRNIALLARQVWALSCSIVAKITVGRTTTLPAGSPATVTNSGTDTNVVLDFGIPSGATGATPNIEIGTVQTLTPGSSATASMTGTSTNPLLNLGIPAGQTGVSSAPVNAAFFGALLNDTDLPSIVNSGAKIPWKVLNNNAQGLITSPSATPYFQFTKLGRYLCIFSLRCSTRSSADNTVVNWGIYAQSISKKMVASASAFVTQSITNISGVNVIYVDNLNEQYNFINNSMVTINVQGATAAQTFNDGFDDVNGVNEVDGMSCVFLRIGDIV